MEQEGVMSIFSQNQTVAALNTREDEKGKHRYTIQMREEITGCANCPMSYRDNYYFGAYGCGGRNDVNPCVLPVPTNDPPNYSGDFIPDWCPLEKANS